MLNIVGEATPAKGHEPFEGRAGSLLAKAVAADWFDACTHVLSLFQEPQKRNGKGWAFPVRHGRFAAQSLHGLFTSMAKRDNMAVLMMSKRVSTAFGVTGAQYFEGDVIDGVYYFCFPHPSSMNVFWSDASNRETAASFFKEMRRAFA